MKFLVDNSIISSLSKIGRLELLNGFGDVSTTDAVVHEAFESHIDAIVEAVKKAFGTWLKVEKPLGKAEVHDYRKKHPSLSYVDCELILMANRDRVALFTDDRAFARYVRDESNIQVFDLPTILLVLKNSEIISQDELRGIVMDLEKKDSYRFTDEVKNRLLS